MPAPVWSRPTESGAYEFGFDDGRTALLPPTPDVVDADANLPDGPDMTALAASVAGSDPMAGATAGMTLEEAAAGALAGKAPAPPPPVATDAGPAAGRVVVGPIEMVGAASKGDPRRADYAKQNEKPVGALTPDLARAVEGQIGLRTGVPRAAPPRPASGPSGYEINSNEPGADEADRAPARVAYGTIKGGPRTAQWNYQSREVPQEAKDMAMDALDTGDIARQMGAMEESKAHKDRIEQARATDAAQTYQDEQDAKAQKLRLAAQADRLAKIDDEISKTETDINPDNYWDSKSTLTKILLGIALFASGSQARGGRPDVVGDAIDKAIARDIDAQKQNIKNRKDKTKMRDSLYSRFVEYYGSERKAELAVRAAYDRRVARNFEIQAAQTKDPARASLLMQGRSDYLARSAATMMELDGRNVTETVVNVPDRSFAIGGGARRAKKSKTDATYVAGYGYAPNVKAADELRETIATSNDVIDGVRRIKELTATWTDRMTPKNRAKAESEIAAITTRVLKAEGAGAYDNGAAALMDRRMGNALDVTDFGGRAAALDSVAEQAQRQVNNKVKAYGIIPATREMTPEGPADNYTGEQPMQPRRPGTVEGFTPAGK